jgi:hypothetical protein
LQKPFASSPIRLTRRDFDADAWEARNKLGARTVGASSGDNQ